jgi:hypothetical protein
MVRCHDLRGSFAEVGRALSCFVVLWVEFATNIARAGLIEINYLRSSKIQILLPGKLRTRRPGVRIPPGAPQ